MRNLHTRPSDFNNAFCFLCHGLAAGFMRLCSCAHSQYRSCAHVHAHHTHTHRHTLGCSIVFLSVFWKRSSAEETLPSWQLQRTQVQSYITHWGWAGLVGSWPSKGREKPQSDGKEQQTVTRAQNRFRIALRAA